MSAKTVIIQVFPDWVDVAVVRGDRVIAARRIEAALPSETEPWMESIRELARPLAAEVKTLRAVGARAYVIYRSPSQAVDLALMPVRSNAEAQEGAMLAFVDSLAYAEDKSVIETVTVGRERSAGGRVRVLVGGDRNDAMAALADLVDEAGLRFVSATPLDVAVANWTLCRAAKSKQKRRCWLYVGQTGSFLLAACDGRIQFGRSIRLGIETVVTSLTRPIRLDAADAPIQLSGETARRIVYTHGVPEPEDSVCSDPALTGSEVLPVLQPVLQRYIIELRQSLRFGLSDAERNDITTILTGPGASVPGLAELLTRELETPVEKDADRTSFDATVPGHEGGELADVLQHRSFLNQLALAPRHMQAARRSSRLKRSLLTGAAAAVALVAVDAVRFQTQLDDTRQRAGQIRQQVIEHEQLELTRGRLLGAIGAMRELEQRIADHAGTQLHVLAAMRELSRLTPETVKLTDCSMRREEDRIVCLLNGYAVESEPETGRLEIESFIRRLNDSPLFDRVMLGKVEMVSNRGREGRRFDATLTAVEPPRAMLTRGGEQ